jgi:hypothetical protein
MNDRSALTNPTLDLIRLNAPSKIRAAVRLNGPLRLGKGITVALVHLVRVGVVAVTQEEVVGKIPRKVLHLPG